MRDAENQLAREVIERLERLNLKIATAESCTGGMIGAALTDIAGSSSVFERGFITYSNEAKVELLGVAEQTLAAHGAVSAETAKEMAAGALTHSRADLAVSVTGIAGPGGGTKKKPVGLVWFGLAIKGKSPTAEKRHFADGDRASIRCEAVSTALELLLGATQLVRP